LETIDDAGVSTSQINEGFCEAGFSVTSSTTDSITSNNVTVNKTVLLTGVPGRHFSTGGAFFYSSVGKNVAGLGLIDGSTITQIPTVPASLGNSTNDEKRKNFHTVPNNRFSYYGYAMSSGFITNRNIKDFVITSPRYTQYTQMGRVYIVNTIDTVPTLYVEGKQFGEYFGYSVATADLNNDGWDDIIVGAPIYAESARHDIGRIFIFWNNEGGFNESAIIVGTTIGGRFGSAITSLGDLNNDGYEDIAVSAPFEGSGVVYIYHGQSMDEEGSIINKTYQQRIDGASFVSQVSNLTSVSGFGFSISGSVDVDQNQYRDLVIGAFDSQSVFVLRAIPVAVAKITLNVTISEINLENFDCVFANHSINCFNVEVCTEYYGRGLESGFSTKYELKEVTQRNIASRLFFTTPSSSSTIRDVTYAGINMSFCENVTVYIKNSSIFDDIILSVELQQIPRDSQPIDTNYIIPSQNIDPVISASPSQLRLPIARECGMDDICTYDLILNHINTVYFGLDGSPHSNQMNLSVGAVNNIRIYLEYRNNLTEDAFNSFITFTLPSRYIEQPQVRQDSQILDCSNKNNDTHIIRQCNIQNRLSSTDGTRGIDITFRIRNIVGNEGTIEIPISIQGNPNNTFATAESNTDNNNILVKIPVYASATYSVEWTDATPLYAGNGSSFNGIDASDLGAAVVLSANVQNNGPSVINEAMLDIFIPSLSPETGTYYYIYPTSISVVPSSSSPCDDSALNPQGYNVQKKRRSVDIPSRERRQTDMNNNNVNGTDCSLSPIGCINVKCNLTNIVSGNINIRITGYIDERFFNGKTASYVLKSLIVVNIVPDGITDIITNSNRAIGTITISKAPGPSEPGSIPWYVFVIPIVGSLLIIAILAIILYFCGFFRRKKHQKEENAGGADDFEQFAQNPFGASAAAASKKKEAEASQASEEATKL
jgi:hypothetical protein